MTHLTRATLAVLAMMQQALRQDPMQRDSPLKLPVRPPPSLNRQSRLRRATALTYGTLCAPDNQQPRPATPAARPEPRPTAPVAAPAPPPPAPRDPMQPDKPPGPLRNGNPRGNPNAAPRCGARTRAGAPCRSPAMSNGRCRMHGGTSTGPRTLDGLARLRAANTKHGAYATSAIRQAGPDEAAFRALLRPQQPLIPRRRHRDQAKPHAP